MLNAHHVNNSNDERVHIYLSFICFHYFYCFSYNYSLTRGCLFACFAEQSFSSINNLNPSSISIFVTMTFCLLPSATGTPQQQQQLQPKHDSTMAIGTYWALTNNCDPSNQQHLQMKLTTMIHDILAILPYASTTRPLLQVQPEHHSSSNNYNRNINAIRQ